MNNTQTDSSASIKKKRPALVWVITIFYFFSAGYTLLSFALIYSGVVPLNETQQTYFNSQKAFDICLTVFIGALNLAGAVGLFLLRRFAYPALLTAFIIAMLLTTYQAFFTNWISAIGKPGLVGAGTGWIIIIAIILYARSLVKKGILV